VRRESPVRDAAPSGVNPVEGSCHRAEPWQVLIRDRGRPTCGDTDTENRVWHRPVGFPFHRNKHTPAQNLGDRGAASSFSVL
jgi:hypothetical protein